MVAADKGLTAYESIQIYDEEDLLSGFCVSLKKNETPSGYVVIKFTQDGEPVVSEYAVDENMEDVYDEIEQTVEKTKGKKPKKKNKEEKKLYSFTPNDYFISANEGNNETFFDNTGKEMSKEDFKAFKKEMKKQKKEMLKIKKEQKKEEIARRKAEKKAIDPELLEEEIVYSGIDIGVGGSAITSAGQAISNTYSGVIRNEETDKKDLESADNEFWYTSGSVGNGLHPACTIIAMMNVLKWYSYNKGSAAHYNPDNFNLVYNYLYRTAGTTAETVDGKTGYYTQWDRIGPTMNAYFAQYGHTCISDGYWLVLFSDFKRDIDAGKPCMFGYNWNTVNGSRDGHHVFVCGYTITTENKYLRVADGWTRGTKYLNFSGCSYKATQGVSFTINDQHYK